jgi:hypothetical protein
MHHRKDAESETKDCVCLRSKTKRFFSKMQVREKASKLHSTQQFKKNPKAFHYYKSFAFFAPLR